MATLVSAQLRSVADGFVKDCGYTSALLSGIVPDPRHLSSGGYHCSIEDLLAHGNGGDYSNVRPDDKGFNPKYGAAFDVTMSRADMIRNFKRVYPVFKDRSDPRRRYVNCINTWSGSGDAVRLDFVANTAKRASADHTWHVHGEMRRRWLRDAKAARAVISILKGETKTAWVEREEKPVPAKPVVTPAPAVHKPGSRTLRYTPGEPVLTGEDVAFVQRFIGPAQAGPADGRAGAKFRAAVLWYQRMRGLKPDGVVGPATWKALGVKAGI